MLRIASFCLLSQFFQKCVFMERAPIPPLSPIITCPPPLTVTFAACSLRPTSIGLYPSHCPSPISLSLSPSLSLSLSLSPLSLSLSLSLSHTHTHTHTHTHFWLTHLQCQPVPSLEHFSWPSSLLLWTQGVFRNTAATPATVYPPKDLA